MFNWRLADAGARLPAVPTALGANEISPRLRIGRPPRRCFGAAGQTPSPRKTGAECLGQKGRDRGWAHLGVDDLVPAERARLSETLPANFANKGSGSRVHRHMAR